MTQNFDYLALGQYNYDLSLSPQAIIVEMLSFLQSGSFFAKSLEIVIVAGV